MARRKGSIETEDLLLVGSSIVALGVVGYAVYTAFYSPNAAPSADEVNLGNSSVLGPAGSGTTLPSVATTQAQTPAYLPPNPNDPSTYPQA
jgi:hypothetical protein